MFGRLHKLPLTAAALVGLGLAPASANPQGPQVVGGAATVQGQGTPTVTVRQSTDRAIINWNTFNIGTGEKTKLFLPSTGSVQLDRVTGGLGPSQILGSLWSNGRIFLVNPDGILFGPGSRVDTAGFLATTIDIKNADFMAGRYNFSIPGRSDASIVNQGTITARNAGFAALVAPGVRNSGTISARMGTVGLAAGNGFSLDMYGDNLITLAINDSIAATVRDVATGQPLSALVKNDGTLRANGGRVELTAAAARQVVDSVINNTGVIEANTIGTRNGMIVLSAATAASKPAGAPPQVVKVSGKLSAAGNNQGTTGGTIEVTGEFIALTGATLDASGRNGGGTVLIGGDTGGGKPSSAVAAITAAQLQPYAVPIASNVTVDATSTINASATDSGNGGKVVVWSDGSTSFNGSISARGGANGGNGGFVETSGRTLDFTGARVDTSSPKGRTGLWLLDPSDLTINSDAAATIADNLRSNDITVQTTTSGEGSGDIFVNSDILWSSNFNLTLSAYNSILVNNNITNGGSGNVTLRADNTGSGLGTVAFNTDSGAAISTGGAVSIFYNPSVNPAGSVVNTTSYVNPTENYAGNVSAGSGFTAYMLVNTVYDLQNIQNNLSGSYALGRNIDASASASWNRGAGFNPIGSGQGFTGQLNGQFLTIDNLAIAPTVNNNINNIQQIGLFGAIDFGGMVQNLNLTNVNIQANQLLSPDLRVGFQTIGALAGTNAGLIDHVTASGTIDGGSTMTGMSVGGLVGQNGFYGIDFSTPGTIQNSSAAVNITSNSVNASLGGLAGFNAPGAFIISSYATGNVKATATIASNNGADCSTTNTCQNASVGGLVGQNSGTILGAADSPSLAQPCVAGQTCATGDVSVGSHGGGGGLVGYNDGIIINAFATGAVTGADGTGLDHGGTNLGGLAASNQGLIAGSFATGNVGTLGVVGLQAGGLVADNEGAILNSFATGNVRAGNKSSAGGLVSDNSANNNFQCSGNCIQGDGYAFLNSAFIFDSRATGNVTVGNQSLAGGLAGSSDGALIKTSAIGTISGGDNSILGGLVGANDVSGVITNSKASGAVSSTGPNSWVGGFVGVNGGTISGMLTGSISYYGGTIGGLLTGPVNSSGPVNGGSDSLIGGFAGINFGLIQDSTTTNATATVTATGAKNVAGGFVGVNFGSIDPSTSAGAVTGTGTNTFVGSFAGANASLTNIPVGFSILGSSFPVGTISTDSVGTGTVNGAPATGTQVGTTNPTSLPTAPLVIASCNGAGLCTLVNAGLTLKTPDPAPDTTTPADTTTTQNQNPPTVTQITQITQITQLVTQDTTVKTTDPVVTNPTQPTNPTGSPPSGGPQGNTPGHSFFTPPLLPGRSVTGPNGETQSFVPPIGETRLFSDRLVLQFGNLSPAEIQSLAQSLGLRIIASETVMGRTLFTVLLPNGRKPRDVIPILDNYPNVSAAPIYKFALSQSAGALSKGDPAQYTVGQMHLDKVHAIASGKGVTVAVIDSEVDKRHSELRGAITDELDTLEVKEPPHSHGTAMAAAIVSRDRLLGVAPDAKLLAVRAFGQSNNTAEGTTLSILKGIEWAISQGAQVINMSFAGPRDPLLERALKAAHDKGIVLVAAAGNAGPKSPPLYPGADPSVIAVTATNDHNQLFRGANQGLQISVAAPGVDILAAAPDETYAMSTGTSIATAHVSGVVALMLERDPTLKPDEVRRILEATATDLGPKGKDNQFGWGLINPEKALEAIGHVKTGDASPTNH